MGGSYSYLTLTKNKEYNIYKCVLWLIRQKGVEMHEEKSLTADQFCDQLEAREANTETGGGSRRGGGQGPYSTSRELKMGDTQGDGSREDILASFAREYERSLNTTFEDRLADPSGVRANMVLPLGQFVDLFLAVPVLFSYKFLVGGQAPSSFSMRLMSNMQRRELNGQQMWLADLYGGQPWRDLYQIFNRKWRTMLDYVGDEIPPSLQIRLRKAEEVFDDIIIATPYLHVVADDLEEVASWRPQPTPEPYAIGLMRDTNKYPFAVVLGRFIEGGGMFPEYRELVGKTMTFLKHLVPDLIKLDKMDQAVWYYGELLTPQRGLGTRLTQVVTDMLEQKGLLPDIVRQGIPLST